MKNRILAVVNKVSEQLKDPYYQGKPAELSFYFMMSIIPTVLLLVQLLGSFAITLENLEGLFGDYFSGKGLGLLQEFLEISNTGGYSIIFILLALWGSSKAQFSLMGISNYAYTGELRIERYLPERVRAIKNSLLMLFSLLFGLILLVYGDIIIKAVLFISGEGLAQTLDQMMGHYLTMLWETLRWLLGLVFYNAAVICLFYNAPTKKLRLLEVLPGSLVTSIGMVIVTAVFSTYTNYTMSESGYMITLYGSFSSIIALLAWFFALGSVLVLGVLTNASLQSLRIDESDGDDTIHSQSTS